MGVTTSPDWNTLRNRPTVVNTVNGQSGTVTTTDYGGIGSVVIATTAFTDNGNAAPGVTVAGSNLNRRTDTAPASGQGVALNMWAASTLAGLDSGGVTSLSLSGTWRLLTRILNTSGGTSNVPGLYVRVS